MLKIEYLFLISTKNTILLMICIFGYKLGLLCCQPSTVESSLTFNNVYGYCGNCIVRYLYSLSSRGRHLVFISERKKLLPKNSNVIKIKSSCTNYCNKKHVNNKCILIYYNETLTM